MEVPRRMIGLSLNNEHINKNCSTSASSALVVDKLSVPDNTFSLSVYEHDIKVQLLFNLLPSHRRDLFKEITDKLAAEGKTIKDLPLEDGYRVFKKIYLIAEDRKMVGLDGKPLTFTCTPKPFDCTTDFLWQPNIIVDTGVIVDTGPGSDPKDWQHVPMTVWNELYPLILERLEGFKVTDTNNSIQEEK